MNEPARQPPRGRAGLTLIEVMLTMVILGIAGIVLVSSVAQCLAVVRSTRLYNHAHALLARVEVEHPLFADEIEAGEESGRFAGTDYGDFEWTRRIEPVGEETDRLFEVTTRIAWTQRGRSGFEEVVFYRIGPEVLP